MNQPLPEKIWMPVAILNTGTYRTNYFAAIPNIAEDTGTGNLFADHTRYPANYQVSSSRIRYLLKLPIF